MTFKNRSILVFLAIMASVFLLSSCNNTQQGNTPNGNDNVITTAVPEDQLEDLGTFTVLVEDTGDYAGATANDAVMQHLVDKIAQDRKVKIGINVIPLPANDFINQANTYLTSQPVDGVSVNYDTIYGQLLSSPGLCAPIDTLLQEYGSNIMMVIGDKYWQAVMQNDQIMGIPSTALANDTVMIVRKDILNMTGLETVQTKDEFLQACVMFKALDKIPLALTWDQINELLSYTYGIPADPYGNVDGNILMREEYNFFYYVYTKKLTEISFFTNQMRSFYERGYLDPDLFTASQEDMRNKFINGDAMIYATQYQNVYNDYLALKANDPTADIMVLSAPTSRRANTPAIKTEKTVDNVLLFMSSGQNQRALMTYKDWMYSDQTVYMEAEYGVIGTHINFNPYESTYEYLDGNSPDAAVYTGLYMLGVDLDGIFPMPTLLSSDATLVKRGEIEKGIYDYLSKADARTELDIDITDQTALSKYLTYRSTMDEAVMLYVTGQITDYKFQEKMNSLVDEGMYIKQYIVAVLTQ